jgi:hypothetical protein
MPALAQQNVSVDEDVDSNLSLVGGRELYREDIDDRGARLAVCLVCGEWRHPWNHSQTIQQVARRDTTSNRHIACPLLAQRLRKLGRYMLDGCGDDRSLVVRTGRRPSLKHEERQKQNSHWSPTR